LIQSKYNAEIKRVRTHADIVRIADKLDIAPGIVAGRFQHLTNKWSYFRDQIRMLKWI
jgi:hypothetical protein